jgi:hypothetical protein
MERIKLYTAGVLFCGTAFAVMAPIVFFRGLRHAGYGVVWLQMIPFLLCAVVWLPRRSPAAATAGLVVSLLLLVPCGWFWAMKYADRRMGTSAGGIFLDLLGSFLLMFAVAVASSLIASLVLAVRYWLSHHSA